MGELSDKFLNLDITEDIFKDIKYFITGEVHEKVESLLKAGGAERQNYFSDYVTHLIVGQNPEENDICDAIDLYEIPSLVPKWVLMCASLKKRIDIKPYIYPTSPKLFTGLKFCFSKVGEDRNLLWGLITYNGGLVFNNFTNYCGFLVTGVTDGPKYLKAELLGPDKVHIVTPDWIMEAIMTKTLPDPALFHPRLINWPKPAKPHESTTAITGFEPDSLEIVDRIKEECVLDSTQALLEKLKQRMPWNQAPPATTTHTTSSSDPVGPPNVVAPSFLNKLQSHPSLRPLGLQTSNPQATSSASAFTSHVSQSPSHIPRSVVHHTPNSQQTQPTPTIQQNPLNISRLIGQPQLQNQAARPTSLQPLRGQLNTSQIHQQLLQQRIQQQNQQNIIQRTTSSGSINIQQQLLQQQLTQGQRQTLMNQQGLIGQQGQSQMGEQQNHLINQQNQMNSTQNQLSSQSPVQNQLMNAQQQGHNQLMSPQQLQNQLMNHTQQNQLMNQPQQNQLMNQSPQNQLMNQPQQNQLINQQNNQQNQLISQQQAQNQLHNLINQQSPQNQLLNQPVQNQLLSQQQTQSHVTQQSQMINTNQLINQQGQQIMSQSNQQGGNQPMLVGQQNQHLGQLSVQQLQQLQHLKREQQQLLNQSQNQQLVGSNQQLVGSNQQLIGQNQQMVGQNQQMIGQNQHIQMNQQQIIQNRVLQQQNMTQQMNQGQSFAQQNLSQHILQQKQQMFGQAQVVTSQHQQLLQSQQNLGLQQQQNQPQQQQFINQTFNQNQMEVIQQQKLNQTLNQGQQTQLNPSTISQMSVQALNQQLTSQNLGPQLNQQLLQQNQQGGMNQGSLNQQNLNQGMGLDQGLIQMNQSGLSQGLNQSGLSQGLNQQQQMNPGISQQVIRTQFQQQMLVNQQQSPQSGQRPQINQQMWAPQQQTQGPGQISGQQIIRHPVNVVQQSPTSGASPRVQWPPGTQPGVPQRQFIQLDAHTHNQLQKMPPDQQALFVAKLQKQRQLQLAKQVQQRAGGHILIRGNVPPGLTAQQQVQWLQQQAKQQGIVLPPNIQQNITPGTLTPQPGPPTVGPHAPGLSPINQNPAQQFVGDQNQQQQQLQLRQYRLQQLHLQREQAQKNHLAQQGALPPQGAVRPLGQPPLADSTTNPQVQVNPKTKTALANMLSIKLQSGGTIGASPRPEGLPEPSAAGTLRMMTAQHNAAINSKPQEIIGLQQRRGVGGPNGDIIKPPVVPQLPLTPQSEPPKLQFSQKPPLPVQHRVGPFYGHNPNLKLSPDLFLLGCIFVVVEVEDYLEEKLPGWQQKIEKYGGEVEKQYGNKVTHVLCETQRHGVVMQALRDCKRCVTIRWLSDVIKRKQVLPPWTALHLPQIYLDTTPASKHLVSISGFEGNLRQMVKQMIQYTGAKCTTYFSKHNTLLICARAEGGKFSHAKKWGVPVVNVQWLTDVILGNFTALNQMENQAYQTYSNPPNLSFDPKLVPNMMHAWKAPINISQDSYERVKRSASPVIMPKAKKLKTEHTDENDNISEEVPNSQYRVLFSQINGDRLKKLEKIVRELGGVISKDHKDFTHLVMPRLVRSHKLLFAITKSCHILSENWLDESQNSNTFLPEPNFALNFEEFNQKYGVTLEKTLQCTTRDKLFENKCFWVTPTVFPSKKIVSELIETSGGKIERIRRSRAQVEASTSACPLSYFILTTKEDLHLVADLLKNKKDKQKVVCSVELVFASILRQSLEVEPYAVSVV